MSKRKILFIDRDGTLINEPQDQQVDSIAKLKLEPNVIPALLKLQQAGFILVMVSNQDGLGTKSFPQQQFAPAHDLLLGILNSQGIIFDAVKICPHLPGDNCDCRKPKLGLVLEYLRTGELDLEKSYVIGDRESDITLAKAMGIKSILYGAEKTWPEIATQLTQLPRQAKLTRVTNETAISVAINLDASEKVNIFSGIGFFDHMLEQLAKHAGIALQLQVKGDLQVDEHHTVEDTALVLGQAIKQALGDKLGIKRYGFLLPMDEALTQVAIDLSGRPYFVFEGNFTREIVGGLATELISHFFQSLAQSLSAAIHIKVSGENNHHMIESIFKGFGRALAGAIKQEGFDLPTTKGAL